MVNIIIFNQMCLPLKTYSRLQKCIINAGHVKLFTVNDWYDEVKYLPNHLVIFGKMLVKIVHGLMILLNTN